MHARMRPSASCARFHMRKISFATPAPTSTKMTTRRSKDELRYGWRVTDPASDIFSVCFQNVRADKHSPEIFRNAWGGNSRKINRIPG